MTSLASTVGRYFTVVSVVPSLLPICVTIVLVRSGAWSRVPDFAAGFAALTTLTVGGAIGILFAALVLGAVLHPVQLGTVRFLEGYWGLGWFWSAVRRNRISYHVRRRIDLQTREPPSRRWPGRGSGSLDAAVDEAFAKAFRLTASLRRETYPANIDDTLPTLLGNALRAAETRVGNVTELRIVEFAPHLLQVAPPDQVEYVNDQRTTLDLVVRTWLVCGLSSAIMVLFLYPYGTVLLTALVPYALAVLSYRGAVSAAAEYGAALQVLHDLNRFALYERLHLRLPNSTDEERALARSLKSFSVTGDKAASLRYRHPATGTPPASH